MSTARLLPWLLATALVLPRLGHAVVVPAEDAATYVGSSVTVEGDVASARREGDAVVLELAPAEAKSFRVVLVLALFSSLPREPERAYAGRRIRATGIVQRFKGRPEMVVESASQIEIVDVAGGPTATTTTTTTPARQAPSTTVPPPAPRPTTEPATAPREEIAPPSPRAESAPPPAARGEPAPAAAPPPIPPPPPTAPPPAPPPSPPPAEPAPEPRPLLSERIAAERCERARARWHDAADALRARTVEVTRCLDENAFNCRDVAARVAPALSELEWAEQQVHERCD